MTRILKIALLGALLVVATGNSAYAAAKKRPAASSKQEEAVPSPAPADDKSEVTQKTRKPVQTTRRGSTSSQNQETQVAPAKTVPGSNWQMPSAVPSSSLPVTGPDKEESDNTSPVGTAVYEINWQSINAGGVVANSASYEASSSAGQAVIGEAISPSYDVGVGYQYGAGVTVNGDCPYQSDFDEDGFRTALDLSAMIDILFAGAEDVQDLTCPTTRADFDCDGFSTALDLSGIIDHLFVGGPGPCDPLVP